MKEAFKVITSLLKFIIMIKIIYLFTMNGLYPDEFPLSNLTWWIYFLVFDVWVTLTLASTKYEDDEQLPNK
jgi:uncharacterized membrane protein